MKKTDNEIFGKFYSPLKALSYHRPYIFSVGSRTIGKSTGWAIWVLLEWIRHERAFIYTRRTKDELMETCRNYFDNAVAILNSSGYSIESFEYKGGSYLLNGKECGYCLPLSLESKYKSRNFGNVWYIIYDEFLPRNGRYLGGKGSLYEVDCMTSLFQTVDRDINRPHRDETTVIFLGNFSNLFNPFFISFGVDRYLRSDSKYIAPAGECWICELTKETEATKDIENSNAYKISTERTRDYAYNNEAFDNKGNGFVNKIKGRKTPLFDLVYDGATYGVYECLEEGILYVAVGSTKCGTTIVGTTQDHRPNYLMVERMSRHPYTKLLKEMYESGFVRFENGRCKYAVDNYMMYMV